MPSVFKPLGISLIRASSIFIAFNEFNFVTQNALEARFLNVRREFIRSEVDS